RQRLLGYECGQIVGPRVLQQPLVGAPHWGAYSCGYHYLVHVTVPFTSRYQVSGSKAQVVRFSFAGSGSRSRAACAPAQPAAATSMRVPGPDNYGVVAQERYLGALHVAPVAARLRQSTTDAQLW